LNSPTHDLFHAQRAAQRRTVDELHEQVIGADVVQSTSIRVV
jgi:hypothetical protein